jgi:hypothetical protein
MSRRRDQRYPLNQPPDGMVVEPALPSKDPMTPSQRSVNNSLATADEENLPPVTDAQGNPVPLDEFSPPDDAMVDPTPAEVRRATMSVPSKGVHFNFEPFQQIAQLHAEGQTDEARNIYNSLDPQSRYVYENIKNMKKVPASEAARLADEFRQMQDRQAMQSASKAADPAKEREQAQQAARVQSVLGIMDKYIADDSDLDSLVGPAAGSFVANEWDKWNNQDRYAKRFELSFTTKTEVLEAAKYVKPLSNDERKFLEEMFPRRDDPPQVWREYFGRTREILSQGLPQQPPAQGTAPAASTAAPQPPQPPANLKPTRIDPVTGQTMTLTQNQQGKWVYRFTPQQQQQSNAAGR